MQITLTCIVLSDTHRKIKFNLTYTMLMTQFESLQVLLPMTTLFMPEKFHCHIWTLIVFLTYLLTKLELQLQCGINNQYSGHDQLQWCDRPSVTDK